MKPLASLAAALVLFVCRAAALPDTGFDGNGITVPLGERPAPVKPGASAGDPRMWVTLLAPDRAARNRVAAAGVSIEEVLGERVSGVATPEALAQLSAEGIAVLERGGLQQHFGPLDFPPEDAAFHNYAEMEAALKAMPGAAPDLASLIPIGKSHQGRQLWAIRLNSDARGTAPSAKPGIVFMGTHHAREHLSTEVPLLLAKHLVENRAKPEIAKLLATRDIYFIPMVNPDGVEYDLSGDRYHMHRKNLRANSDGSVGVDLNRNYGFGWGGGGASTNPRSDTYRGPSAFSEPESLAIKAFVEARPNLKILLSYHTFSELILYPWGHLDDPIPDKKALAAFKAMANSMAQMTGYTPQQSSELYIASGDTCDWAWGEKNIFAFTFELTPKSMWDGGFYPGAKAIQSTFLNNIRPALYLMDLADDPYRAGGPSLQRIATGDPSGQTSVGGKR